MRRQIVEYPDNIREQIGVDTTIFVHDLILAKKLNSVLSDDFKIICNDLRNLESLDENDWREDALYRSHIAVISPGAGFNVGYFIGIAMKDNPIEILTLNQSSYMISDMDALSKNSASHFTDIEDLIKHIEGEQ